MLGDGGHRPMVASICEKAIYQSCDVFFYTLAEQTWYRAHCEIRDRCLGLGQKTGIDLPNEVSGVMPSEEWKIRNFKQKWFAGETISVGIGQGAVAITPVQLLRAISRDFDGRQMVVPHVINPTDLPPGYVEASALHRSEELSRSIPTDGTTSPTRCRGCCCRKERLPRAYSGN